MLIKMKPISTLLMLIAWGTISMAQSPPVLNQYVETALKNNQEVVVKALSLAKQEQQVRNAKGLLSPKLSLVANYTVATGGRQIAFPVGDLLNPVYGTLNQLTESNQFPTDLENVEEQFLPNNFQETKVRLIQPLFNTDLYYNLRAQKSLISAEEAQLESIKQELVTQVKTAYYQYLQSVEALKIYESNINTLQKLVDLNQKLVASGQLTPQAVYQAKVELSALRIDLENAHENEKNAKAYFNFLLNRGLTDEIEIEQLEVDLETGDFPTSADRPELLAVKAAQQAQSHELSRLGAQKLPSINLAVDAGFQGFGYEFSEQEFALAQIGLEWNLFSGFTRKSQQKVASLELESLQQQEDWLRQQIDLQRAQAKYQYEKALKEYQLHGQSVELSRKSLEILQRQYEQGQALLIELISAQNTYFNTQQTLLISKYKIPMARTSMNRAWGI